ncbi:MAG: hypothetical protein ABEH66_02945 [Halobacteriales archaeon]
MFEAVHLGPAQGRDMRVVVGVLSAAYVLGLAVFLPVGPFLLSSAFDVSLGAAFEAVVGVVGLGYAIGGTLLLR